MLFELHIILRRTRRPCDNNGGNHGNRKNLFHYFSFWLSKYFNNASKSFLAIEFLKLSGIRVYLDGIFSFMSVLGTENSWPLKSANTSTAPSFLRNNPESVLPLF